jgi:hypothetical protein
VADPAPNGPNGRFKIEVWIVSDVGGCPLPARSCLPSVSVSVSVHPGTTPNPKCLSSLYPHDSKHGDGRERVGVDLESV